jgi:hypothetical protein
VFVISFGEGDDSDALPGRTVKKRVEQGYQEKQVTWPDPGSAACPRVNECIGLLSPVEIGIRKYRPTYQY